MALTLKEELHRLVDEIPDSRPDVTNALAAFATALIHDLGKSDPRFQLVVQDLADLHAQDDGPEELSSRLAALPKRWARDEDERNHPLPRFLAEAPEDDEPLTPEEIAMLHARRASVGLPPARRSHSAARKLPA